MCSESHYCTLVEYIICHAAFTGCHLAERLQCSWKPLSDSNDIIKIGARGMVGVGRRHRHGSSFLALRCTSCVPRQWDEGCGSTDPPLEQQVQRPRASLRGPGGHRRGRCWHLAVRPCPHRTSAHLLEGSNLWTPRPAPGCPSHSDIPWVQPRWWRARGVQLSLGWGHSSWEALLEAVLPGTTPARPD